MSPVRGALSLSIVACLACISGCTGGSSDATGTTDGGTCPTVQLTGSCAQCMQTSCPNESAAALGPSWASHDFTGGACSDLVDCYCNCGTDRACVDACDVNRISAGCHDALQNLSTCTATVCASGNQCAPSTFPDASTD